VQIRPASSWRCTTAECRSGLQVGRSIVRDVNYGWLLRNMHASGASMFFLQSRPHVARPYYGSYKEPREVLWILGVIIYLLMMATPASWATCCRGANELLGRHRHHQPVLGPCP